MNVRAADQRIAKELLRVELFRQIPEEFFQVGREQALRREVTRIVNAAYSLRRIRLPWWIRWAGQDLSSVNGRLIDLILADMARSGREADRPASGTRDPWRASP